MSINAVRFEDTAWVGNKISRRPNDYLYAQRSMKHKVTIHYNEMQNLFIDESKTSIFLDEEKFSKNEFEEIGGTNSNNATNLNQLYSEKTYNKNITHDKYFYLDGKTTFDSGVEGANGKKGRILLSRNYSGETEQIVGWMSRTLCDENGYFANPVRLIYKFKSDHSIVKWLIRSVADEVPVDFSVNIYDGEKNVIYKSKVYKNNTDNRIELTINRGRCQYIELRISRWGIKDETAEGGLRFQPTGAKIVYFYHHATFPTGMTDYKSNDLLQSFSVNEYLCSSIGKANYGVQSSTGQFTLININKLFDTLKSAGYLKNGLKVQYFVAVNKYYTPHVDESGNVNEEADANGNYSVDPPPQLNAGQDATENPNENYIALEDNETALSLEVDRGEWVLLATQYITDIEFDEVKHLVKFKTQDRMIKFKDNTYSGYKKIANNKLTSIRNCDLVEDIMQRASQKPVNEQENTIEDVQHYKITQTARNAMQNRIIDQGYLDEMSTWSALQKACDADLIHTYIDRDDILIIDKIDQL